MKAIVVRKHGPPSVMAVEKRPEPAPGAGEVRVAVRAAGVNFADVLARLGVYAEAPPPPFVPGIEVAGEVELAGTGVTAFRAGDRVAGFCKFGGYAEKVVVPARYLMPIPAGMGFETAAAIPVQYLTAWYGLCHLAGLRRDETLLVHAAAGGVGHAVLELARRRGARIVATVGSPRKADLVRRDAPDARTILYREEELGPALDRAAPRGLDVVMDSVGGSVFRTGWKRLAPGGRYVLFGAASAVRPGGIAKLAALWRLLPMLLVSPVPMIGKCRSLHAFNLFVLPDRRNDVLREGTDEILRLHAEGVVRPEIGLSLPLERAAEAHDRMQRRETHGKIVLTVAP